MHLCHVIGALQVQCAIEHMGAKALHMCDIDIKWPSTPCCSERTKRFTSTKGVMSSSEESIDARGHDYQKAGLKAMGAKHLLSAGRAQIEDGTYLCNTRAV